MTLTSKEFNSDPMRLFFATGRITGSMPKPKVTKKQPEWHEQLVFCKYIRNKYPELEYFSDLSSAGKQSKYMQSIVTILKSRSGWPDTKICEPVGKYVGLMIELKKIAETQSKSIYKQDGSLKASEHVENQSGMHQRLRNKGWRVEFAQGANEAISLLEAYLDVESYIHSNDGIIIA